MNTTKVSNAELAAEIISLMPQGLVIPIETQPAVLANKMAKAGFAAGASADDTMFNITGALLYMQKLDLSEALMVAKFGLLSVFPIDYITDVQYLTGWSKQQIAELIVSGDIHIFPDGTYHGQEIINFAAKCSIYSPRADFSKKEDIEVRAGKNYCSKSELHPEFTPKKKSRKQLDEAIDNRLAEIDAKKIENEVKRMLRNKR